MTQTMLLLPVTRSRTRSDSSSSWREFRDPRTRSESSSSLREFRDSRSRVRSDSSSISLDPASTPSSGVKTRPPAMSWSSDVSWQTATSPQSNEPYPRGRARTQSELPQVAEEPHVEEPRVEVEEHTSLIAPPPPDAMTTLMIRNIPNKYTQRMLLAVFREYGFDRTFDFLYAPVDFRSKTNYGYCFMNFVATEYALQFTNLFSGFTLPNFKSSKKLSINYAEHQGAAVNIAHLQASSSMNAKVAPEWRPLLFDPNTGAEILFPIGNRPLAPVPSRRDIRGADYWRERDLTGELARGRSESSLTDKNI